MAVQKSVVASDLVAHLKFNAKQDLLVLDRQVNKLKKSLTIFVSLFLVSTSAIASAATGPQANGACTTAGKAASISGKTYQCSKNLGGKLVWMLPAPNMSGTSSARPNIAGGPGNNGGHPSDEGSPADLARHAAMKKFSDCLAKHGVTQMPFGGGPDDHNGAQPTFTKQEQDAMKACAAYRPKFGPGFGHGPDDQNGGAPRIPGATSSPAAKA
jgi:hypothetical protein